MADNSLNVKWTIANVISALRGLMALPVAWVIVTAPAKVSVWAAVLFVLAALTDGLDGYLARVRGEVTSFGAMLDPVADKLLGTSVFVALCWIERLPWWMLFVLVAKELALLVGGVVLLRYGRPVPSARAMGKWATIVLFFGLTLVMVGMDSVGLYVTGVGVGLSVLAGVDYGTQVMRGK